MITIVGTIGCNKCLIIKRKLENKGIDFRYILLNDLDKKDQDDVLDKARENGISSFPIILRDDEVVKIDEVI